MSGFETEPWELGSAAGVVRDVGEELHAGLSRLGLDVDTLLDGWRGPAGTSFAAGWSEWRAGASDVLAALEMMARLLDVTRREYDAVETANVDVLA